MTERELSRFQRPSVSSPTRVLGTTVGPQSHAESQVAAIRVRPLGSVSVRRFRNRPPKKVPVIALPVAVL